MAQYSKLFLCAFLTFLMFTVIFLQKQPLPHSSGTQRIWLFFWNVFTFSYLLYQTFHLFSFISGRVTLLHSQAVHWNSAANIAFDLFACSCLLIYWCYKAMNIWHKKVEFHSLLQCITLYLEYHKHWTKINKAFPFWKELFLFEMNGFLQGQKLQVGFRGNLD